MMKLAAGHREGAKHLFPDDYPNLSFVHGVIENLLPGECMSTARIGRRAAW